MSSFDYLESFADEYYLNKNVADIDIENIMQETSIEHITSKIKSDKNILELGIGTGNIINYFSKKNISLDVLEGSKKLIEHFNKYQKNHNYIHGLFEEFHPKKQYDTIFALHVFEHVEDPNELAEKMYNWLTPEGRLIVVVPNKNSYHRILGKEMGLQDELDDLSERDKLVGHLRVFGFEELEEVFLKKNYTVEERFGFFLKTVSNNLMLNYPKNVLIGLNKISFELDPYHLGNIGLVLTKKY